MFLISGILKMKTILNSNFYPNSNLRFGKYRLYACLAFKDQRNVVSLRGKLS